MADAKKPGVDFEKTSSLLKEHEEAEHIDDILERLSKTYTSHKASVGNKRKLSVEQAEALGNKLYDEMTDYLASYYKMAPGDVKKAKAKGKFGDSLLENAVRHDFDLDRKKLVGDLKKAAENGTKFSTQFIHKMLDKNIGRYNSMKMTAILQNLDPTHKEYVQGQIKNFLKKHNLDESKYKGYLKPGAEWDDVVGAYASLAGHYYKPGKK